MQLHFSATGNFRPLQTSLRSVNQQVNRSMTQMGQATATAVSPLNQMGRQLNTTGRISNDLQKTFRRNSRSIISESKAIASSTGTAYRDASGNAKVYMDVNQKLATSVANLGDRFRFMNTVLHGVGRNMIAVGKNMQWAGRQVTVGLTVPLGLAAVAARRAALEYNEQFTRILKVNNEASQAAMESAETFDLVSQSIRRQSDRLVELGASMGFASNETSAMVAELSQMGFFGSQLDQISESAMRLSRTAGTDLTTSLELSRLTAQAFNVPLDQLTQTFARLNIVENNTALSLDELAKAMPVVAGVAATMGMEIEETAGLMAMMKENGIGANEGATALRTGLLRIVQDATDPAIEAFEKINLNLVDMQERMAAGTDDLEAGDIMIFFDELSAKLKSMEGNQAQLNEFAAAISKMVGVRSSARFLSFLTEVGDRFDENSTAGRAWLGVMTEAEEAMRVFEFEEQMVAESAAGIAKRLKAELNVELVKLGENFLVVMNKMHEFAVNVIRAFNNLSDRVKNSTLIFLGFVAALGPVSMMAGIMTNALGQVLTIVTKILPKFKLTTVATQAQKIAFGQMATATVSAAEANNVLAASLDRVAAAEGRTTAATGAVTASRASAAGLPRAKTVAEGGASARQIRNATAQNIVRHGGTRPRGTMVRGTGDAALTGAIFFEKVRKSLLLIPRKIAGGAGSLAMSFLGTLGKGLSKAFSMTAGKTMIGQGLGLAGKAIGMGGAKGVAAIVGGAGAGSLAGIASIIAAIAAIPILADPKAFMASFSEVISGPMSRLREIWDRVTEKVQRIMELFRQSAGSGGGLSKMAEIVGKIAGFLGSVVIEAINIILRGVNAVMEVFEGIMHLVDGIGHVLKGEWSEAGEAFLEMGKAIARAIMSLVGDAIAWVVDKVADLVDKVPGFDWLADDIRNVADGIRDAAWFQSNLNTEVTRMQEAIRENQSAQEDLNGRIEEGAEFEQQLIDEKFITEGMTDRQILQHDKLTDEMKAQVLEARRLVELRAKLVRLESVMLELEDKRAQAVELANSGVSAGSAWRAQLNREITETMEETEEVMQDIENVAADTRLEIEGTSAAAGELDDGMDDAADATAGVNEEAEALQDKLDDINEKIRESERAAKAWASALKSSVSDVINDIADAAMQAFEQQKEQMDAQFDEREESIESAADAELERLDAIEEREAELEKQRKRWFEQQKARIDYLKNMEQQNVRMGEMVARGDLAEASVIRIGLQRDAEAYMLDSYEREAEKHRETKRDEVEDKRAAVEETKRLALEQLEVERNSAQAGYEARKRAIELYLEDWRRITPRTEAEFRQHVAALSSNMRGFGINMRDLATHYADISGHNIFAAFSKAIRDAELALDQAAKWEAMGRRTGAAYRQGLVAEAARIQGMLDDIRDGNDPDDSGGTSGGGRSEYLKNQRTQTATEAGMTWKSPSYSSGVAPDHLANPSSISRMPSSYGDLSNSGSGSSAQLTGTYRHGTILTRHSGGDIDGRPNMPGLKRDESAYVLQHGEYVVRRDAVKALGLDYMERINQAKRHDGGLIDFSKNRLRESGAGGGLAGYAFGKLASLAAADVVRDNGGDPKMTSRDTATRGAKEAGKLAGQQLAEVVKSFAQQGALGSGTDWRRSSDGYPPRRWAQISANTRAAQEYFRAQGGFPGGIGAGVHRGVQKSDHSWGKALDFMVAPLGRYARGEQKERGWQVANWHIQNPKAFGTKYVIWDKKINSGDARGWRDYSRYGDNPGPTLGHYDHVHVSYLHDGGLAGMEGLRKGGKIRFDDSVARLHRGETVVDAAGTRSMENAVKLLTENAGGGGNVYELNIKVEGGNMDEQRLAKAVMREIETAEVKHGRKRVVKG